MENDKFDFDRFQRGSDERPLRGGTDGVFAPMLKQLLESMLEGELDHHLKESKASGEADRKNGKAKKTLRSLQSGHFELESGCDRNGTFEPKIVPKRQLIITDELEGNVMAMHARGDEYTGYFGLCEGNVCHGYIRYGDLQYYRQGHSCTERMA